LALGAGAYDAFVAMLEQVEAADAGRDWPHRFVFRLFE
jgi:hypothetical protein